MSTLLSAMRTTLNEDEGLDRRAIDELVLNQQAMVALTQLARVPPLLLIIDAACVAVMYAADAASIVLWVWFIGMQVIVWGRRRYLERFSMRPHVSAKQVLDRIGLTLMIQGVWHGGVVALSAVAQSAFAHYAVSIIMLGVAAGAIVPAAGYVRIYAPWAAVFAVILGGSWIAVGTLEGWLFAGLLLALLLLFVRYVRDQGHTTRRLVVLAERLRMSLGQAQAEKDRAEAAHRQAEAANASRTRFFAAASHDLRQPLHALSLNAAAIKVLASREKEGNLGQVSQMIQRSLAESRLLLDALLEISELDAGAVEPRFARVNMALALQQTADHFATEVQAKGLQLRVLDVNTQDPSNVWAAYSDPVLLARILNNVVGNAIKFTMQGQVTLSAQLDPADGVWRVCVQDTGTGIPESERERIFEEFYQLGNPQRDRTRGLGLGLSIVRRLAGLIDAEVTLLSSSAEGSCFELCLPAVIDDSQAADVALPQSAEEALSLPQGRGRRVLVLDDEQDIRDTLSNLLGLTGWEVRTAADGPQAHAALQQGWRPDVLVLDFRLQNGVDGLDVWRELVAQHGLLPAVLVTGDTAPQRIAAAQAAGLPLLFKPVDGEALITVLDGVAKPAGAQL